MTTTQVDRAALLAAVQEFAQKEIAPQVAAYDRDERFPEDLVRRVADLGWVGAVVHPDYGGLGLDWLSFAQLIEAVSQVCHIIGLAMSLPSGLVGAGILRYGTEAQKRRWITPLVRGETFAGAGVTEPGGGTDVAAIRTLCWRAGDGYVINGSKAWISMLEQADWFLTLATIDPAQGRHGICAFVVERDRPGLSVAPYHNKLGFRPLSTGNLKLDEVFVPSENLIGAEGDGYRVAMEAVETGRLSVAARALGLAQASLDASVSYARTRQAFGADIGRFQLVQSMITDMVVGIEGARHMLYDLASKKDVGVGRPRRQASLAKMHASDVAMNAATSAVQIHGAYGVSEEYPVARYFRDAKVFQIIEGNNQLHKSILAEYALGYRQPDRQ